MSAAAKDRRVSSILGPQAGAGARRRLRRSAAGLAAGLGLVSGLLGLAGIAVADAGDAAADCETKPYVVKIHADWCGSCRATQATWDRVVAELADQATMVRFDVTDRASYEVAVAEAEEFGLSDFLQDYRRRTGTIAVLDCRTREPLVVLSGERDFTKYREAIEKANSPS